MARRRELGGIPQLVREEYRIGRRLREAFPLAAGPSDVRVALAGLGQALKVAQLLVIPANDPFEQRPPFLEFFLRASGGAPVAGAPGLPMAFSSACAFSRLSRHSAASLSASGG